MTRRLASFYEKWLGRRPVGASERSLAAAERRLGPLPRVVRAWYELLGAELGLLGAHPPFVPRPLSELSVEDGLLVLLADCQWACWYGARHPARSADPPAVFQGQTGRPRTTHERLSDLLLAVALYSSTNAFQERRIAHGGRLELEVPGAAARRALSRYTRLPVSLSFWPGEEPTMTFHGDADTLCIHLPRDCDGWPMLRVLARTPDAWARASERVEGLGRWTCRWKPGRAT